MYNKDSQLKFKTSMLKSSLCDYSDAYILAKGTISIVRKEGDNPNNANKEVVFENCAPFIDCINEINNTEIDNVKDIDVVVPMYNLIEHSNNYSKSRVFFFKLGFTPCIAEQSPQGMESQEKKHKKDYRIRKICLDTTYS